MSMRLVSRLAAALCWLPLLHCNTLDAQTTSGEPDADPTGNAGVFKANVTTGCGYDAHTGNASRSVTDLEVPNVPGDYGLDFTRHWNSVPSDPTAVNGGWTYSWDWGATYGYDIIQATDGGLQTWVTSITIGFPDGRASTYTISRGPAPSGASGPPYSTAEATWKDPAGPVTDHLCGMAPDGSNFWLYRGDGGAVHFEGGPWSYQATEVFDPHGLRTALHYGNNGRLDRVTAPNGRFLSLEYQDRQLTTTPYMVVSVLSAVQTGGSAGTQRVEYDYGSYAISQGSMQMTAWALIDVRYVNDLGSGQDNHATYRYDNMTDSNLGYPIGPVLVYADDPHFAGPMTKIKYSYLGGTCPVLFPAPIEPYLNARFDRYYATATSITAEMSGDQVDQYGQPILVSRLYLDCYTGYRSELTGLGGSRALYFGRSAGREPGAQYVGDFQSGYWVPPEAGQGVGLGYQLVKVTDFTDGSGSVPFEYQHYSQGYPWRVFDGRGNITQLTMVQGQYGADPSGRVAEVWHRSDNSRHTYNWTDPGASAARDTSVIPNPFNHWLFSQTDERSLTTTYRRDERRRITDITYPGTSTEHFTYTPLNQVESHTLPSGATVHYQYYPGGSQLLWKEWNDVDGLDARKEYTYDEFDRVKTMQDGRARAAGAPYTVMMDYNGRNQVIAVHYPSTGGGNADPHVSYEYDAYGNCTATTDEMGHRSTYTFDTYRRCTSYTEPLNSPDAWENNMPSRRWDWGYDRVIARPDGTSDYSNYLPDAYHTKNEWRWQLGPAYNYLGDRPSIDRGHDVQNRIVWERTGWVLANSQWIWNAPGETVYYTYDENGQKKTYTDPHGRRTSYEYDNRNRLWKTNETENTVLRTTETLYDFVGNKTMVKFPAEAGVQRTQQWLDYDAFGQPGRFIDERGNTTNILYWWGPMKKLGMVTTHRDTDSGGNEDQTTVFSYDFMGRPTNVWFPDGGYAYGSHEDSSYEYGQLKTWRTRKGQTKTINYDARGREISHTWDDGQTPGISRSWDDANRMTSIWNSVATINYTYDDAAQVLSESESIAGAGGAAVTGYRYYGNGTIWNIIYPNQMRVAHAYTPQVRLQTVWDHGPNNWQLTVNYTFTGDGKIDHADYGNGTTTAYGYNGRGLISAVQHKRSSNGQNLSYRDYYRDERDRIYAWQKSTDNSVNPMEDGRGDHYQYDAEGQLTDAWYGAVDPANTYSSCVRQDHFAYDALGNRFGWDYVQSKGWMHFRRRDNGLNEYLSWENDYPWNDPLHWGTTLFYDEDLGLPWGTPHNANGVLMEDGWNVAGYNALNQPIVVGSSGTWPAGGNWLWFGYDPLGRCVKHWFAQSDGSSPSAPYFFIYDGWNLIEEGYNPWNPTMMYYHGARTDEILSSYNTSANVTAYHHYDASGHCTMLTDGQSNVMEQYYYDAFGYPYFYGASGNWLGYSPHGNRFLFTGREWIDQLKLYDFRNRLYNPELGRFMQPDPKEFGAGDYNLYRYCHNDPVNRSDPTGLSFIVDKIDESLWRKVKAELRRDPDQRKIIDRLDRKDIIVRVWSVQDKFTQAVFDPKIGVRWNLHMAYKSKADPNKLLSPLMALGHELDHIYQAFVHPDQYRSDRDKYDAQYDSPEERRVETGSEASMFKTYFNESPRQDHKVFPYPVADPFSR